MTEVAEALRSCRQLCRGRSRVMVQRKVQRGCSSDAKRNHTRSKSQNERVGANVNNFS